MKILVVDDEPNILSIVEAYLIVQKYEVVRALTGAEALQKFEETDPDLIILDLMLPDISGVEVCRKIRAHSEVPIIMLTAKSSEKDILAGLKIGADDYVSKPFSPKELVARVETVLRRVPPSPKEEKWFFHNGELEIRPNARIVLLKGREVELTTSEFEILTLLASHPSQVFTREQLLDNSKGIEYEGTDRVIDTHVKNLRHKLEEDPRNPRYILTVYGTGYRFGRDL